MIPQPLKWVGAILALGIAMVVVAPFALDSMLRIVEFEDDSGLFSTDDDADPEDGLGPLDPFEDEAEGNGEEDADTDDASDEDAGGAADEDAADEDAADEDAADEDAADEDAADEDAADEDAADEDAADEDAADEDAEPDEVPETYEVQSGDTLYSIAEEVYGDGARWTEIAEANGIAEGSALSVGMVLDIP